jgi:Transcriptional regulatory protein, C terminal
VTCHRRYGRKSAPRRLVSCGARCYIIPKIIDVFICKLRKKLALAGADNLIGTVWGRGYMIREPSEHLLHHPAVMEVDAA